MLRGDYKASGTNMRAGLASMPRISSVKANQRKEAPKRLKIEQGAPASYTDPEKNPYFDTTLGGARRTAEPRGRRAGKQFQFVKPGRFVEQAERLRNEARLEQLKTEIAARADAARLEDEVFDAHAIRFSEPPEVEWWDAPFVSNSEYNKVVANAPLITIYIQHPVPVEPPVSIQGAGVAVPSQLILTRKERKKVRRQRRLEAQREHREKVMLGLLPPDEPKLRLSNFMRIMANQSVPDPTRLEAEVRKQMQARAEKHEAENKARMLTKEQKTEKNVSKLEKEESKGIVAAVFRVDKLKHVQHRYKVSVNAKESHLTGTAIVCPQMSVVVVEGPEKYIKAYTKLMLRRIDWTDSQPRLDAAPPSQRSPAVAADSEEQQQRQQEPTEMDYSQNACHLIWQGEIEQRRFAQFRLHDCPTETMARRRLGSVGCESYWALAKQFTASAIAGSDVVE
ncbi:U4/U5/U6 small nuclear ribonucleoprotein prp3 [Coemansia sp. RSA 2322]|nr:U4/U5/U6 small nuclear ribonucleoprotein prp3 [Coemansia sp. RSA 2322]